MRVIAVIPTLNEVQTVGEVVKGSLKFVDDVLVVDGGSEDDTCKVAVSSGARCVCVGRVGKGVAVRYAIATAEADVLVFIDGDGSHDPGDIPLLLEPIIRGEADLVIGSRLSGGSDELQDGRGHLIRALGTRALQALVNARFRTRLTDIQNGFRAVQTQVARNLGLGERGFCVDQEMSLRCLRKGYPVANVPSHEFHRRYGKSHLNLWTAWPRFVWNAIALLFGPQSNDHDNRHEKNRQSWGLL